MTIKHWAAGALIVSVIGGLWAHHEARPSWAQEVRPEGQGLLFRISPGSPEMAADGKRHAASATPLSQAEVTQLLHRLPAIKSHPKDKQTFVLRESSKPAPRTAKTIAMAFPPHQQRTAPNLAAALQSLQVTSMAPIGDVEMAPHMTVSFNQAMVPITSLQQLETKDVPVRLSPQPAGKWRWLGTQTLMFVPSVRFPMATDFHVEIPAGVASATGKKLEKASSFDFQTPAVLMESHSPSGSSQPLRPTIFMRFNQEIDQEAVFATVKVMGGAQPVACRLASAEELTKLQGAAKGRCLALVPQQSLSAGTTYTVEVGPGTPSKEGPKKTVKPQSFSFATYEPLKIEWSPDAPLPPLATWSISFNNVLEASKFKPELVRVTPELPGMKVKVQGSTLQIHGRSRGRTQYTVHLAAALTDHFGQTLGHEENRVIQVSSAQPSFSGPAQSFTVLDPVGPRELSCNVINYPKVKLKAWRVQPSDWAGFMKYIQERRNNLKDMKAPGELVIEEEIDTRAQPDDLTEVKINLARGFNNNLGHLVVELSPSPLPEPGYYQTYVGWIQSTHIGLDAMADHDNLLAWASDLASGKSMQGVELSLLPKGSAAKSDDNGLAKLPLGPTAPLLLARKGEDVAILPRDFSYWNSNGWSKAGHDDQMLWYVIDDRKLYRPGEKVSLKGWMRRANYGALGDIVATSATTVSYRLSDSRGNEVLKGDAKVGRLGGFNLELSLPKNMNLGHARLSMSADGAGAQSHSFRVEEFRRPEFEVSASASPSCSLVGEHASVTTSASYFAGGPLANAQVDWSVTSTPTSYSPPHWPEFTFGTWTPWWSYHCWWTDGESSRRRIHHESQRTRSDSGGKSTLRVDFQAVDPPQPTSVKAQATVQDVNRQAWSTSTSILVHPSSLYVGLKSQRTFVEKGQPLELAAVVTDLEGKAVSGKTIQIKAYRLDWEGSWGETKVKHADEVSQQIVSAGQPVPVKIATGEGGTYQVEALISDDHNRRNRCEMTVWVAGGKQPPSRKVEQETVTLVPSKKEYTPNETAEVLVQAPFAPAELVVTTRRNGLAEVNRVSLPSGSGTLKFPLQEVYVPGLTVQVDAIGAKTRTDANGKDLPGSPQRPAYASGSLSLKISNLSRKLQVEVTPDKKSLQPGSATSVNVRLKDSQGRAVKGEVALMMVDEAVLAMTGYDPADPLPTFCFARTPDVVDSHLRQYILLSQIDAPEITVQAEEASGGMSVRAKSNYAMAPGAPPHPMMMRAAEAAPMTKAPAEPSQPAIRVRSNFNPLAIFAPAVQTDNDGRAKVPVKLPDNLTRYRLVALAAAGDKQFGKGESSVTARQPLMVRPSAPRFLNFGDRFEMPVVVQNQTDQPMQVSLACRATNARVGPAHGHSAGYSVKVPANDRVEVRVPCAADMAGTARFQFGASSGKAADAAEIDLPVWTPATTEAFATYGVIDQGAITQPIEKPGKVFEQFGGLTVTTSSTALAELTDAFLYLTSYPFECSEQIASRMLAAAALKDVLEAFKAPGMPDKASLESAMKRDLQRLRGQQNGDGGWDYWVREAASVPYLSVHVAHTLVRVKAKGFAVDPGMLERSLNYLKKIESHLPAHYPDYCKRSIRAYAVYVLNLAGQPDVAKARALAHEVGAGKLSMEGMGWLLPTLAQDKSGKSQGLVDEIFRYLDNHVTQTASTAQFNTGYQDNDYLILHSSRRDDGILLEALVETRPSSPIIPKLVRGLLDHRTAGRWGNTQENCWVLLALDRYFQKFESVTPDFVAQMWLGPKFAGEQHFRGRNKDEYALEVPMSQLASPLVLNKEGKGRLYYRIGLKYAPIDLKLPPADYGFAVQRTYEAVKDNRDVRRDSDGRWHVKAGSEVKVTVTMQAPARRYHVALVDPLPAGFEALNPSLLGSGDRIRPAQTRTGGGRGGYRGWWWTYHWYNHQNLRDERAEAFTQLLWEGVYTYSYIARATTPGDFVVPPAKAEEMYHPETFGRSASDRVIVDGH